MEEPYFARSSVGVQILNRILDECISLTRLRPVSTKCCWKRRKQRRVVATTTGGGRGAGEAGLNAIINLCLALRQWVEWRKQKEGFKPRVLLTPRGYTLKWIAPEERINPSGKRISRTFDTNSGFDSRVHTSQTRYLCEKSAVILVLVTVSRK